MTALQLQASSDIGARLPSSALSVLASAMAGLAWLHYGFLDWISKQSVPWSADGEFLDGWAALKGVLRQPATPASGSITFTGTDGSVIPAGSVVQRSDGQQYTVDGDVTISVLGDGTGSITAVIPGSITNTPNGTILTLVQTISGVDTTAETSILAGGSDIELDPDFRTRMIEVYANPPMGGDASNYVIWSEQVPGVTRAWCLPNGAGVGTVTVFTMWDISESIHNGFPQGTNGVATAETRDTPATGDQLIVANWIYNLRPVTALVYSYAPTAYPVNLTINRLTQNTTIIRAAISDAIASMFVRVGNPLGMTLYQSDIVSAIQTVPGVQEFVVLSPTSISIPVGSLPTLGTVTYT